MRWDALTGQSRRVHGEPGDTGHRGIRRYAVTFGQQHHVLHHQFVGGNLLRHTVAQNGRTSGKHPSESFGGVLRTLFLREGEDSVEHHDHTNIAMPS